MSSHLEFIQINLQHCKGATSVLDYCLTSLQTFVAIIHEPWVRDKQIQGLDSTKGTLYRGDGDYSPRACIYTSRGVTASLLPQLSSRDVVTVSIEYNIAGIRQKIIIASVYLPYDSPSPPPTPEMERLIEYCRNRGIKLIIGCDANSHHLNWGSTDTNARGDALFEFLSGTNLEILNRGHAPTYVFVNRRQVLDITLATNDIAQDVHNWRVSEEVSLSDHRQIRFHIQTDVPEPIYYRNPRTTNWDEYRANLIVRMRGRIAQIKTIDDVETELTILNSAIMGAYEDACPNRKLKQGKKTRWWNKDIAEKRKDSRKSYRRALASGLPEDWEVYRREQREYKKRIRQSKRETWRSYCTGIENTATASRLRKMLISDRTTQPGMLQLPTGEYTSDREQVIAHLLETHFPGCELGQTQTQDNSGYSNATDDMWRTANQVVTVERTERAIMSFAPYKSPGNDGIYPVLLQEGLAILSMTLCRIFQACLALGYIPIAWRTIKVVFIPKPGKATYALAKSFRGISLASFLLKTLERMVDWFLRGGILLSNPMHANQHAYQSGKSTETALHRLVSRIDIAIDRNAYALGAFFDIEGAFDNAPFKAIERALGYAGVNHTVIRWIGAMLKQRSVQTSLGEESNTAIVHRGFPQGGVLSPLLWCLVVDKLVRNLNEEGYYMQAYSDDGAVLLVGQHLDIVSLRMQSALNRVVSWCEETGLAINPSKTELVLFTKKRITRGLILPKVNGTTLKLSDEVKFLGVKLDSKLSWTPNVNTRCQKAIGILWQCRRIVGRTWGLTPSISMWLYTSVIRPILGYAVVVWWARTELASIQKQLNRVQRLACVMVTGAMKNTPTAALEVLLNLPPLHIFLMGEAMAACYRMIHANQWSPRADNVGHAMIRSRMDSMPILRFRSDYIIPHTSFEKGFRVSIPERDKWANQGCQLLPSEALVCYTDGSRLTDLERSGAGIHFTDETNDISIPLGKYATVFQAEMHAILTCALTCLEGAYQDKDIYICSDSQAALKSLASEKVRSKMVDECINALKAVVSRNNRVELLWIPGHTGLIGNEAADELARQAASMPYIGPEPALGITARSARTAINDWCHTKHCEYWAEYPAARQAHEFTTKPSKKNAKNLLRLGRPQLRLVVGILTGHARLNRHLHLIGVIDDPLCQQCTQESETSLHFIGSCDRYMVLRQEIFGSALLRKEDVNDLKVSDVQAYIRKSGRFDS